MKKTKTAAIAAAFLLILSSCNWFRSAEAPAHPLTGKWQLDSVSIGRDSNIVYAFLLASAMSDSSGIEFNFEKDSLFTSDGRSTDTAFFSFDEKENKLLIKDSIPQPYVFTRLEDSVVSLTASDSTVLFLRRK